MIFQQKLLKAFMMSICQIYNTAMLRSNGVNQRGSWVMHVPVFLQFAPLLSKSLLLGSDL